MWRGCFCNSHNQSRRGGGICRNVPFIRLNRDLTNRWILVLSPCSVEKVVAGVDRETLADIPKCEARHCQRWSRAAAGCTKVGVDGNTNESLNNESDLERV